MTDNDSVGDVLDKRVCEGKQLGVDAGEKLKDLVRGASYVTLWPKE